MEGGGGGESGGRGEERVLCDGKRVWRRGRRESWRRGWRDGVVQCQGVREGWGGRRVGSEGRVGRRRVRSKGRVGRACEVTMRVWEEKEDKEWKGWYAVGLSYVNNLPAKTVHSLAYRG